MTALQKFARAASVVALVALAWRPTAAAAAGQDEDREAHRAAAAPDATSAPDASGRTAGSGASGAAEASAPDRTAGGTIEGRIELSKTRTVPVANLRYGIVSAGGVLSPNPPVAVVYLEGPFPRPPEAPVRQVAQKDLAFVPMLLPVQAGTRVEFPNQDDTYHNIFSFSPAKRFDLGRYRSDEKPVPSETFDTAGLVTLRCDIHEHMRGLILVLETPYFVRTEPDGRFRLTGLPPGRRVLKVWLDSRTTLERPVEIERGAVLREDFP